MFRVALALLIVVGAIELIDSFRGVRPPLNSEVYSRFTPPDFSELSALGIALLETIGVAVSGTTIGFLAALFAITATFSLKPGLLRIVKIPIWFLRGVPDVVMVVILLQIIGAGPITGIVALALGTFGVSGLLISNSISTRDRNPESALLLGGRGPGFVAFRVILPLLTRDLFSQFMYRIEINFRIAIVLGLIGGGGLGLLLDTWLGQMNYQKASSVIVVIALFLFAGEHATRFGLSLLQTSNLRKSPLPAIRLAGLAFLISSISFVIYALNTSPFRFSGSQLGLVSSELLRPDFLSQQEVLWSGFVATLSLSAVTLVTVFPIALGLGVLSSRSALGMKNTSSSVRQFLSIARSVPIAVLATLLVIPLGFGTQTAFLAMVIGGSLFLGRLIGDLLDSSSTLFIDTLLLSGVGRLRLIVLFLAENRKKLIDVWFFSFDYLFRYSVILGILGSGGLGTVILNAIRVQDIRTVAAATIMTVAVVGLIEAVKATSESKSGSKTLKGVS